MQKKVAFLMILCFVSFFSICQAGGRPIYKITQFHFNTVKEVLQIEIGLNKESKEFSLQADPQNPQNLILQMDKTKIGNIKNTIPLDKKFAEKIVFQQTDKATGVATISLTAPATNFRYRVFTRPEDKNGNFPFRLVIEISKAASWDGFSLDHLNGKTIVLDPGHGGSDSGAVGPDGVMEKDVTFKVAQKVQSMLEAAGTHVIMTRQSDVDVYGPGATDRQELQARVDVGLRTPQADLFLSIHANSFSNPQAHGTGTYYYPKTDADGTLALALQKGMVKYGGLTDRGISEANFYVVKRSPMPAALVEMAFISNSAEQDLLASDEFQDKMAHGICLGLNNYFVQTEL